jgi:MYXO-CTERM domain-containing protein
MMTPGRSRLIVGVGVLFFVGVMVVWLASSGDKAIANPDRTAVTNTVSEAAAKSVDVVGTASSVVSFPETAGVVHRLSVYLNVESTDARGVKAFLTSPSGTKVLLVDGATSNALRGEGLEGWFGTDGLQTTESLASFAGESVMGEWKLTVQSGNKALLRRWSITVDLAADGRKASMETFGEYAKSGGCDCRVAQSKNGELAFGLLLLAFGGLVIRRRHR